MKRAFGLFLIPVFIATLIVFTPTSPASAGTCSVTAGSGSLASGGSISVTAPAGHTYNFVYTGAASGNITVTGTLNIVNGTGGTLFYTITDLNGDCGAAPAAFFNPGDGRVDPLPGDLVAVYCNTTAKPPTLDVWGVTNDSVGHRLYKFAYADLLKAGKSGLLKKIEPMGSIFASTNGSGDFSVEWFGGPDAATGVEGFAKSFTCNFAQ
jgi:hypothetical protein